jgi:site-specific DNA recombinase
MRWVVSGKAASGFAASASQMGRFETRWLTVERNLSALANLPGQWITVQLIFQRYAELGSVTLLRAELDRLGIVSKRREGAGRLAGGRHFLAGALYLMLQNRIYRGEIVHQGAAYPGQHKAILDPELCQIAQGKLTANRRESSFTVGAEAPSLLAGLIVGSDGSRMTPTHATKKAKRYRYYVSASLLAGDHPQAQKRMRIPAGDIEGLVLDRLRAFFSSRTEISDALVPLDLDAHALDAALRNAIALSKRWHGVRFRSNQLSTVIMAHHARVTIIKPHKPS